MTGYAIKNGQICIEEIRLVYDFEVSTYLLMIDLVATIGVPENELQEKMHEFVERKSAKRYIKELREYAIWMEGEVKKLRSENAELLKQLK